MKKFRTSAVAALTAGALALSATPAMAQEEDNSSQQGETGQSSETGLSSGTTLSSQIADATNATEQARAVWGSSKSGEDASEFTWIWYGYTLAATAALVGGAAYVAYPAIQDAAADFGVQLPDVAPLPF